MYNVLVPNPDNKHMQKCHAPCKLDPNQKSSLPFSLSNVLLLLQKLVYGVQWRVRLIIFRSHFLPPLVNSPLALRSAVPSSVQIGAPPAAIPVPSAGPPRLASLVHRPHARFNLVVSVVLSGTPLGVTVLVVMTIRRGVVFASRRSAVIGGSSRSGALRSVVVISRPVRS